VSRLVGEDFSRLLTGFEHTAFRLELLRRYTAPAEEAPLRRFLAGEPPRIEWAQDWLDQVAQMTAAGKSMQRVRVVDTPPGDYLRFELALFPHSIKAGEEILILDRDTAAALGLPDQDFWLWDSSRVALMHYDDEGSFLGAELIEDPRTVVRNCYWRDAALHFSMTYQRYMAEQFLLRHAPS
jgi:hypothetical protein